MKHFDLTSFLIGAGGATALVAARQHLRPVVVELAAAGIHFGKIGLGLLERQREHAEDLWAEIDERVKERVQGHGARASRAARQGHGSKGEGHRATAHANGASNGASNGAGASPDPRGHA